MSDVISPEQEVDSRRLWIQLLAGPLLWSVHFLVSYLIVEAACQATGMLNAPGSAGLSLLVIVLTGLAVIASLWSALRSYRSWRAIDEDRRLGDEFRDPSRRSEGPVDFMYVSGFLLSALFAVAILMTGLPAIFLQPC